MQDQAAVIKYCPHCGTLLPDHGRFCENCGASFANIAEVLGKEPVPEPESTAGPELPAAAPSDLSAGQASGSQATTTDSYSYGQPSYESRPSDPYSQPSYGAGSSGQASSADPYSYGQSPYESRPSDPYGQPSYGTGPSGQAPYTSYKDPSVIPESPARRMIEDICRSPFFLTFTIMVSLQILLSFMSSMVNVFVQAPLIVICIGLWFLYINSARHKLTTTGFSLVRGGLTASMVISIIAYSLAILIMLVICLGMAGFGTGSNEDMGLILMIFLIIVAFLVLSLVITILFYRGLIRTTSSVRDMLISGYGRPIVSNFARVLFIIKIILSGFSTMGSLFYLLFGGQINSYLYNYLYQNGISEIPYSSLPGNGFTFQNGCTMLAGILGIAILVMALMIFHQLETTPFDRVNRDGSF